jgi:hypothetical protein
MLDLALLPVGTKYSCLPTSSIGQSCCMESTEIWPRGLRLAATNARYGNHVSRLLAFWPPPHLTIQRGRDRRDEGARTK